MAEKHTPQAKRRGSAQKARPSSAPSAGGVECKVLQKNFRLLCKAVAGEVADELYAREIIDHETLEFTTKPNLTEREKGHRVMQELKKAVQMKPDLFEVICEVLEEESMPTRELARNLRKDYESLQEAARKRSGTAGDFDELKSRLEVFVKELARPEAPQESIHECIKSAVQEYVKTALKPDRGRERAMTIQKQMQSLCYDLLIPSCLQNMVLEQVEQISKELMIASAVSIPKHPDQRQSVEARPPLFGKNTLYHASVCCHALSTCDSKNVQAFLRGRVSGHRLEEISISEDQEGVDCYLIAKEKSTLYVAFQSEVTLSAWIKKYSSFDEGIKHQAKRIPLRFFAEQLLALKRIVLTGFSFGGMLACCVAANIWKNSYQSTQSLEENVICITFGQPLISIPFVLEATRMFPEFEKTIHSVFDKRDLVPRILRYFNVGCIHSRRTSPLLPAASPKAAPIPERNILGFEGSFASCFLSNLSKLQDAVNPEQTYSGAVSSQNLPAKNALLELKEALEEILSQAKPNQHIVLGSCYLMTKSQGSPEWSPVQKQEIVQKLGHLDRATVEKLGSTLFKQHNMEEYRDSVFTSYLGREPSPYKVPTAPKVVKEVAILKPQVKTVEFHEFPTEHILVLEGDFLWFCHSITLGEGSNEYNITTPPQNVTQRSIQFTFAPTDQKKFRRRDGQMKVTLCTHFEVVQQMIGVKQEPYTFSPRQIQLAKHTPSEIIQLAYLSALLEWHPTYSDQHSQSTPSKRFKQIAQFVEEAVKVVPMESIFFAIAHGDYDTALECATAVTAFQPKVVASDMMEVGSSRAALRMKTGVAPKVLDNMIAEAFRRVPFQFLSSNVDAKRNIANNSVEVIIESVTPAAVVQSQNLVYTDSVQSGSSSQQHVLRPTHTVGAQAGHRFRHGTAPGARAGPQTRGGILPGERVGHGTQGRTVPIQSGIPVPVPTIPVTFSWTFTFPNPPQLESTQAVSPEVVQYLNQFSRDVSALNLQRHMQRQDMPDIVCNMNIEQVYPIFPGRRQTLKVSTLQSPIVVLRSARDKLATFIKKSHEMESLPTDTQGTQATNQQMLELIRSIFEQDLKLCAGLLGAFMEQRVCVPLLESPLDTAKALSANIAPVAVGVWVLFSTSYRELHGLLAQVKGNALQVEIVDYVKSILSENPSITDSRYAAKLQFLLQGVKKTVTCSSQYISYSLEHQLCSNSKVSKCKSMSVRQVTEQWGEIFKGDALSLVAKSHRPLIARWLKWAILIHGLREALAKCICVGVAGLVNSGKSRLVNSLFKVKTLVGTTDVKRTTVPFMYNLDGEVDGLDVIDFPGVDDKDHSVPELAKLMIGLAQVVIFVVNYRKVHSDRSVEWIRALQREHVPVLVCLTHADRLYAECKTDDPSGNLEATPYKERVIGRQLQIIQDELGHHPSQTVKFYCFYRDSDSTLTDEMLKKVGIGSPSDVGNWLADTFDKLDQKDLATKLRNFVQNKDQ